MGHLFTKEKKPKEHEIVVQEPLQESVQESDQVQFFKSFIK